jgi:Arc/MetJ family transcription regulator
VIHRSGILADMNSWWKAGEKSMRTTIDIDESLLREAIRLSGIRTKKGVVEAALRLLIEVHSQTSIRRLRGTVRWEGEETGKSTTSSRAERSPHKEHGFSH